MNAFFCQKIRPRPRFSLFSHSVTHVSVFPLGVVVLCVSIGEALLTHPCPWLWATIFHHQADGAEPYWKRSLQPPEGSHAVCCRYDRNAKKQSYEELLYLEAESSEILIFRRLYDDMMVWKCTLYAELSIDLCLSVFAQAFSAFVVHSEVEMSKFSNVRPWSKVG